MDGSTRGSFLGAVGDTRADVRLLEQRVLGEDLLDARAARQEVEDERDPDAMAADAGLPKQTCGSTLMRANSSSRFGMAGSS
jgi:hypothetical protein